MNNIEDKSKYDCTGCGACVVTCPTNAIEYKINEKGFYQAFVNKDKCIKCGKCKKVCSKFLQNEEFGVKLEKGKVYSAQSTNEENIQKCTSGGIAYEISKYGIENNYKIVGTIYDYEQNIAKTVIAENVEELNKLKGSKYVQSNTIEAYKEIIEIAKKEKNSKFIIFGTPCQIAGINKMIKVNNITNEILKIELFCHGVPSYLVWEKYRQFLKEKYGIEKINELKFRDKKLSWHEYFIHIKDENENKYVKRKDKDLFYQAFLDNILLNTACQTCEFRKSYSMADIRIGDFWGKRYANREDGISAILIMNNKGTKLINDIEKQNKIKIIEEVETEECLNAQSRKNYKHQELRENAFKELQNGEQLQKVIKNYRKQMPLKTKFEYTAKGIVRLLPKRLSDKIKYMIKK